MYFSIAFLTGDALAVDWSATVWSTGATTSPNVLLVILDDVGAENVGAYGGDGIPEACPPATPNLDALADSGVRFTRAWSQPMCSPTRAAVYTGRFPSRTGVGTVIKDSSARVLSVDETTLPEVLADASYDSALMGKWHLGATPELGGSDAPRTAGFGTHLGILGGTLSDYSDWTRWRNGSSSRSTRYATTAHVDDAKRWIERTPAPWLMSLSFTGAHAPYHVPTTGLYTSDLSDVTSCSTNADTRRRCYKAAIEAVDSELGRLLSWMDTHDLLGDTMVVVVGDNGTPKEALDDGVGVVGAKGTVYERGVHVPLIIAGPQVVDGGREDDSIVNVVDLYATIAEMAGLTSEAEDSVSLMPIVLDTGTAPRSWNYTEIFTADFDNVHGGSAAIRDTRYKLVEKKGALAAFYDLDADPDEATNLIDTTLDAEAQAAFDTLSAELDVLHGHP